ncbi:hypothetical protein PPTG_19967 [Phytophthora nicotianae INRA-310]|uniref:Uncharacterized protein n=1 Tax=Phytophthora nicotianae (strain INRA-310) TaxID=761204 RepID=W2PCD5_PHYN3|nr:hypothetical protein PPTG_19967 [Phytophthora nicotianae INRA-310]ETM97873.1 hypothetical protein PPTG_19967 [Phytophthora nicotianae INRA-310]
MGRSRAVYQDCGPVPRSQTPTHAGDCGASVCDM